MMGLADVSLYVTILANIGPVALAATTNLTFNFLRKPERADLIAECRLLKLGKSLAVGEVAIRSDGLTDLVVHATGTYSIPPQTAPVKPLPKPQPEAPAPTNAGLLR